MEDFRAFVEKVKQLSALEEVVEQTGAEFRLRRKYGNYLRGEVHDSLVVRVDEQFYMWNSTGERGDVLDWVMVRRNVDFMGALEWLAERARLEMPTLGRTTPEERHAFKLKRETLGVALGVLQKVLWETPEAVGYCEGRGWTEETIREHGLGFTGVNILDTVNRIRGEFSLYGIEAESPLAVSVLGYRGEVKAWGQRWGVEVQSNWVEWGLVPGLVSRKRLVYPHMEGGKCVYLSGRNIMGDEVNKEGRTVKAFNLPKELAGERQMFWNAAYGRRGEQCVVVEGQADAVTLGQWGVPAVALAGTSWEDHEEGLGQLRGRHERVYVGLDGDEAGQKALVGRKGEWKLGRLLGATARVVMWTDAGVGDAESGSLAQPDSMAQPDSSQEGVKDANDLLQVWVRAGVTAEEQVRRVGERLNGAETMVELAARQVGTAEGAEREKRLRAAFGLIGTLDKVGVAQYRKKLCDLMRVGLREFNDILKASKGEGEDSEERPAEIVETLGGVVHTEQGDWLVEYLYDVQKHEGRLAWRDPGKGTGSGKWVDIEGRRYVPKVPNSFIKEGAVLFPSEVGQLRSTRELVALVEAFITSNYLLEQRYHGRIMAYYVMLTWLYDCFNAIPYLRATGEAGAGKSEMMKRVGHVCYRLMTASGANTASSFFRATEMYRGTVFIDEADLHDGGDMSNDIIKFLNLGAMKGNGIWRLEEGMDVQGNKTFEPAVFQAFCPKLIAMRKDFRDDAVASRSLTFKLMPREPVELVKAGVKLYVDEEFRERARGLRNLLLRWRLEHWQPEIEVNESHIDLEISSRLNQVTGPLKALAKDDAELQGEIERFLRAYNREMVLTRSMTIAARVVEAVWKIHSYPDLRKECVTVDGDGAELIMIGDITRIANEIMDVMNQTDDDDDEGEGKKRRRKKDELSARGVGSIVRNELQLQVRERRGKGFPVAWDEGKMEGLAKRYGVDVSALPPVKREVKAEGQVKEIPPSRAERLLLE